MDLDASVTWCEKRQFCHENGNYDAVLRQKSGILMLFPRDPNCDPQTINSNAV